MKLVLGIALSILLAGCDSTQRFESVCQIVRKSVVETDDSGKAEVIDVELEWDPCPGDQFQVVRGGQEFAACMGHHEEGELVPVFVKRWWDNRGYFRWDLYRIADCSRTIEPDSEGSYEKSQECSDEVMFGRPSGFNCSRKPFRKLVAVCPWMGR